MYDNPTTESNHARQRGSIVRFRKKSDDRFFSVVKALLENLSAFPGENYQASQMLVWRSRVRVGEGLPAIHDCAQIELKSLSPFRQTLFTLRRVQRAMMHTKEE